MPNIKEIYYSEYNTDNGEKGIIKKTKTETYNEKGLINEAREFGNDGELIGRKTYEYDDKGNRTKLSHYRGEDILRYWFEFQYDSINNGVLWLHFIPDGTLRRKFEYKFDEQGNQIEEIEYVGDNSDYKYRTTFVYANSELKKSEQFYSSGKLKGYYEYSEDKEGNITKKTLYIANGNKKYDKTYSYENMDEKGNWQTKNYSKNGSLVSITERKIKYWE